jgi:hypothetical protein
MLRIESTDRSRVANKRKGMHQSGDIFRRNQHRAAVFAYFREIRT